MESADSREGENSSISLGRVFALLVFVLGALYLATPPLSGNPSARKQLMSKMSRVESDLRATLWPQIGQPPEPLPSIEATLAKIPGLSDATRVSPFGEDFLITAETPSGAKLYYLVEMKERRTERIDEAQLRLKDRELRRVEREKSGQLRLGREVSGSAVGGD